MREIDQGLLWSILRYEPLTGRLFWKERPRDLFDEDRHHAVWNAKYAGHEAFTSRRPDGYHVGAIFGVTMRAHLVIWMMMRGCWPDGVVDHINGNPSDNRFDNLRAASHRQNSANRRPARRKRSRFLGVFPSATDGKWRARADGVHLGTFATEEAAAVAYDQAASIAYGAFARRNFGGHIE